MTRLMHKYKLKLVMYIMVPSIFMLISIKQNPVYAMDHGKAIVDIVDAFRENNITRVEECRMLIPDDTDEV